jgi:hypothetical protein
MNDPGLDGAIADAEKHHGAEDDIEQEEQEEEDLLLEPRWVCFTLMQVHYADCLQVDGGSLRRPAR